MSNLVEDVLRGYSANTQSMHATGMESDPIKLASELGAQEADKITKLASYMGELIGQAASRSFAEFLGYEGSVVKQASFQDLLIDSMIKVADQVSGNTAQGFESTNEAASLQADESAAHHANMAARSAMGALEAAQQGDGHTAGQLVQSAQSFLEQAKGHAAETNNPAVIDHIDEAEEVVAHATAQIGG